MTSLPTDPEAAADALIARFAKQTAQDKTLIPERPLDELSEAELAAQPCVYLKAGATAYADLPINGAAQPLIEVFEALRISERFTNLDSFDVGRLRQAEAPWLGGVLAFLPHRQIGIEVPFFVGERSLQLARRTNEWIYAQMEDRPSPQLDDDLINYVRFFFSTIVGRIGAYRFATRVEDAAWLPDSPGEKKQEFAQKLSPLSIVGTHEGGRLECRGTVIFKNALFIMSILVSQNWEMEISNEELLIEDLPVVFGQKVDLLVQR